MKVDTVAHNGIPLTPADSSATPAGTVGRRGDLWKACQSFEALFMGHLVSTMEKTLPQGALAPKGLPNLMFNQVMGTALSEGGGIGLAELLYRNLQSQEGPQGENDDKGVSLREMFMPGIRKDDHDETPSR